MLNFGDTLFFSLDTSQDKFTTTASYLLWNQDNLIYKAVDLYRKTTGFFTPISIHLKKRIPSQAGLGGGSSNAATTLYALNKLFGSKFSDAELAKLGQQLGADVPCFFGLGRVYVEGIGEKLTSLDFVEEEYTIVKPCSMGLSTPLVYKNVNLEQCSKKEGSKLLKAFQDQQPIFHNDLEHAAFLIAPELKVLKDKLVEQGFKNVVMTGSGSAFLIQGKHEPFDEMFLQNVYAINRSQNNWYLEVN